MHIDVTAARPSPGVMEMAAVPACRATSSDSTVLAGVCTIRRTLGLGFRGPSNLSSQTKIIAHASRGACQHAPKIWFVNSSRKAPMHGPNVRHFTCTGVSPLRYWLECAQYCNQHFARSSLPREWCRAAARAHQAPLVLHACMGGWCSAQPQQPHEAGLAHCLGCLGCRHAVAYSAVIPPIQPVYSFSGSRA